MLAAKKLQFICIKSLNFEGFMNKSLKVDFV